MKKIEGIELNQEMIKAGQFADDLWSVTPAKQENIKEILKELVAFKKYSGLTINPKKSMVIKLGPFKNSDAKYYTMKKLFWSDEPIKILGCWLTPDRTKMEQKNYTEILTKIDSVLDKWRNRDLTLMGKTVVINSLVNTLLVHRLMTLPAYQNNFIRCTN